MNYIILDLEWDNVYVSSLKRFVNQILQIGAVKLDENFEIVDTFEAIVRSCVSKKVTNRFTELTGITTEKMLSGMPYQEAIQKYNVFAGGAQVTMTWSDSDLYTIVENENLYSGEKTDFNIDKYLDLQKLVQGEMQHRGFETKNQISLENAAALFKINTSEYKLHTALDDSLVCAKLLKLCYNEKYFNALLRDAKNPDFFKRLRFKPYPISDADNEAIKKGELEFKCPICFKEAKKFSKWKYRNRWFSAAFQCKECKHKFIGRIFAKQTFDGVVVKRRISEFKKRIKPDEMPTVSEKV